MAARSIRSRLAAGPSGPAGFDTKPPLGAANLTQGSDEVSQVAAGLVGLVALAGLVFPRLILAIFIHDPLTLELAVFPMRLLAATMAFDTVGTVLMNALLGAGDSRRVMVFSVLLQWGLFLPFAYLLGPTLGFGMTGIWMAQVFYRLLQTISFIALWRQGKWASIRV